MGKKDDLEQRNKPKGKSESASDSKRSEHESSSSSDENLDEEGLQQEVLDHIANPKSYYDYSAVNQAIEMSCNHDDVLIIPIEAGEYLLERLQEFSDSDKNVAVIPLHLENHFAGIIIKYDPAKDELTTIYFDPLGADNADDIPQEIKDALSEALGINEEDIIITKDAIQSSHLEGNLTICDNVHCGAFVGFALSSIINNDIRVDAEGNLNILCEDSWTPIEALSEEESDKFGKDLRKGDLEFLQDGDLATYRNGIAKLRKAVERRLQQEQENFEREISGSVSGSLERSRSEFSRHSSSSGRNTSGDISLQAIEVDKGNVVRARPANKNAGYDENFMTQYKKSGELKEIDDSLGLGSGDVRFSEEAFEFSRLPSNSYIHFKGEKGATTSHAGGLKKPISELKKSLKVQIGKLYKDAENERKDDADFATRYVSTEIIKKLKSTKGDSVAGSSASSATGFHSLRHNVIKKIVAEAKASPEGAVKKKAATKATGEVLKFVVNNTVGYRDNTAANDAKFKGITIDGLNLEDETHREYALKHYQAQRDLWKMGILKYEDRLNDVDSAASESDSDEEEIDLLNRKLARTALDKKYHDVAKARELSPLRADTPYSKASVGKAIVDLKAADDYKKISIICATPIPTIRPTEGLIEEMEKKGAVPDLEESLLNLSVSNAGKSKFKPIDSSTPIKPRKSLPKDNPSASPSPTSSESSRSNSPEVTK